MGWFLIEWHLEEEEAANKINEIYSKNIRYQLDWFLLFFAPLFAHFKVRPLYEHEIPCLRSKGGINFHSRSKHVLFSLIFSSMKLVGSIWERIIHMLSWSLQHPTHPPHRQIRQIPLIYIWFPLPSIRSWLHSPWTLSFSPRFPRTTHSRKWTMCSGN